MEHRLLHEELTDARAKHLRTVLWPRRIARGLSRTARPRLARSLAAGGRPALLKLSLGAAHSCGRNACAAPLGAHRAAVAATAEGSGARSLELKLPMCAVLQRHLADGYRTTVAVAIAVLEGAITCHLLSVDGQLHALRPLSSSAILDETRVVPHRVCTTT